MPYMCSVPGCKLNYRAGPSVSVFSFPIDEELRNKWLLAIGGNNFILKKNSKVCSLHFEESELERETSVYCLKTGRTLTTPLGCPCLKKGAVPSIFNVSVVPNNNHLNKLDQEEILSKNVLISPSIQENIASTETKNSYMMNTQNSDTPVQNKSTEKLKEMPSKKKKKYFKGTAVNENEDSFSKSLLYPEVYLLEPVFPLATFKVENPWGKEHTSLQKEKISVEECDKLPQIEISSVQSISTAEVDENNADVSKSSSMYARPLNIQNREAIFGKLVASEMSDLCQNPELYLKTKKAILDVLVQAHFQQIK